jgi:hypothetical protein
MADPVVRGELTGPAFVLVDETTDSGTFHGRIFEKFAVVEVVPSIDAAALILAERDCSGLVFRSGIDDGSALAFVRRLRALDPLRVAALDARPSSRAVLFLPVVAPAPELRRQADALHATIITMPGTVPEFELFARQALAARHLDIPGSILTGRVAHEHALSAMETSILALEVGTVPRASWPAILGIESNTIRTYIERVCKKSGVSSIKALAAPTTRALMTGGALPGRAKKS